MAASTSTYKSASPCGCGGSSARKTPSGCGGGCGGTCSACADAVYARPQFFAGQLLTEDDLQQLNDYIVAKNRLHNSHLFGSGVVCGLEVTCYSCPGGKVTVQPGYALDCCGNDIVISCPQDLDINQMIRDLQRKKNGGKDCGDPCPDTATTAMPNQSAGAVPQVQTAGAILRTSGQQAGDSDTQRRKYCLYVNYCEQKTDPVAPYATDDPCNSQQCQPTRVREGFRFELRCPDAYEPPAEICRRISDCLGPAAEQYLRSAEQLYEFGSRIVSGSRALESAPSGLLQDFDKTVQEHISAVNKLNRPDSEHKAFIDAALDLGSDVAQWFVAKEKKPNLEVKNLYKAAETLHGAGKKLTDTAFQKSLSSDFERAYASSLGVVAVALASAIPPAHSDQAVPKAAIHAAAPVATIAPNDIMRLLAEKVVYGLDVHQHVASQTEALRAQLLFRLEEIESTTHCGLLDKLSATPVLTPAISGDFKLDAIYSAGLAATALGRVWMELQRACYCNALLPPCPSCDDPGVLLACITLEKCCVKDICNLDRKFVLSPVSLRYWIPEISRIGRIFSELCCPDLCPDPDTGAQNKTTGRILDGGERVNSLYASRIIRFFATLCPGKGTVRKSPLTGMLLESADASLTERVRRLEDSLLALQGPRLRRTKNVQQNP